MDDIRGCEEDSGEDGAQVVGQSQDGNMYGQMPELSNTPLRNPDPVLHSKYTGAVVLLGVLLAIALLFGISVGHSLGSRGLHTSNLSRAYKACRGEQRSESGSDDDSSIYDDTQDEYDFSEEGDVYTSRVYTRNQTYSMKSAFPISRIASSGFVREIDSDGDSTYQNVYLGYIKLKDNDKTLIVSEPPGHADVFDCVAGALSMPESIRSKVGTTTALGGQRTDSWGSYTITWSYSGFKGLDVIIESK